MLVVVAHPACHPSRPASGTFEILDLADSRRFEAIVVGADRVYAERSVHPTDAQYVAVELRGQRIAMEAIASVVAPPVAVALMGEGAPQVDALFDRDRRPVWIVETTRLESDLLVVVHEQTHRVAAPVFGGVCARFIEEGLCDWIAHRVRRERRPRERCPIVDARAKRLRAAFEREHVDFVDLVEESERFDIAKYGHSLSGVERALREESEAEDRVAIAYGCAFAWWLEVSERDRNIASVVLASRPRSLSELLAALPSCPRHVDVQAAMHLLEAN